MAVHTFVRLVLSGPGEVVTVIGAGPFGPASLVLYDGTLYPDPDNPLFPYRVVGQIIYEAAGELKPGILRTQVVTGLVARWPEAVNTTYTVVYRPAGELDNRYSFFRGD